MMTHNTPVPIPHDGTKPEWLDDNDRCVLPTKSAYYAFTGKGAAWTKGNDYFLPADHWAAPVLRAGMKPWWKGDAPDDWDGMTVMYRGGVISKKKPPSCGWHWGWSGGHSDIIGYLPKVEASAVPKIPEQTGDAKEYLIKAILRAYHSTRLNADPVSHILSKPQVQDAFSTLNSANEWAKLCNDQADEVTTDLTMTASDSDIRKLLTAPIMAGYAMHYGPKCRECADTPSGICEVTGMPCAGREKATMFVCEALEYGFKNGFVDPQYAIDTSDQADEVAIAAQLAEALQPFARYVGKSGEKITLIWGNDSWTNTLKPEDFYRASDMVRAAYDAGLLRKGEEKP